jgi:hypothetical protein
MTESEFLKLQAQEAKAKISQSLKLAQEALGRSVDPRPLTRQHPWIAIASATVAGFTAAVLAVPSKQEAELRRLERLHRATHPQPPPAPQSNGNHNPEPEKPSLGAILLKELIAIVKPILLAAITAGIKAGANPPMVEPSQNASAPTDPPPASPST